MYISILISTYNPCLERLNKTINGLKQQSLSTAFWELIIIDNNSSNDFASELDISWHPGSRVIYEQRQGLTYARLMGFKEAKGEIIIMVDDDNLLNTDYLEQTLYIFKDKPLLGAIGGKSLPIFEAEEPDWLHNFYNSLALRDLGDQILQEKWENSYPQCAPIGAGMAIRRTALKSYIDKVLSGRSIVTDRTGTSLTSGGDNDIVIEVLKSGFTVGYFPALQLQHIIPVERMQVSYLAKLNNNTNRSWVQLLENHDINPWGKITKWTVPLRKAKAWFNYKPWKSKINYIYWRGACGTFDGLAGSK